MIAASLLAAAVLVSASPQDETPHTTPAFLTVLERGDAASIETWFERHPTRVFVDTTNVLRDLTAAHAARDAAREGTLRGHATRLGAVLGELRPAAVLATVLAWDDAEHAEYHALARAVAALRDAPDGFPPLVILVGYFDRAAALGADALLLSPFVELTTRMHAAARTEEAIELAHRVRVSAESAGDPYAQSWAEGWLGQVLWQRGELREAATHLTRTAELERLLGDTAYRAKLFTDLAMVHLSLGELDEGRLLAEEAEAIALPLTDDAPLRAARQVLASTYLDLGEHEEALARCLALAPAPPQPVPEDETQVRIDLLAAAVLSDIGRRETALTFAKRAHRTASLPKVRERASLLVLEAELVLGLLLGDVGRGEEGLAHLETARAAFAEAGNPRGVAWAEKNRGWIHLRQGAHAEAEAALRRALDHALALDSPHLTALCAVGVAEAADAGGGDIDEELLASQAVAAAAHVDVELSWRIAAVQGRQAVRRGDDEAALALFTRAVDDIERWRRRLTAPGLLTYALRDRGDPYRGAAHASARLGRVEDALRFSELLRARVLFELRAGRTGHAAPEDDPLAPHRRRIAALSFRLREGYAHLSEEQLTLTRLGLAQAEADLEAALVGAEVQGGPTIRPERPGAERAILSPLASLSPALAVAHREAAGLDSVLSFLVGEKQTLALHVTDGGVHLEILPVGRTTLGAWVDRLRAPLDALERGALDLAHLDFDHRAARALHDALIAPFAAALGDRVGIVADDCLTGVPFELLVVDGTPGPVDPAHPFSHLATLRFLGLERALTYFTSLRVPATGATTADGSLLVFAAPAAIGVPSGLVEFDAVAATAAGPVHRVADATLDEFRRRAPEAAVLHVIAHGFCDAARPSLGHLVLGDGKSAVGARLEAWEIERMELRADLAVLSACHTAEGAWFAGEGLVGLTRSFLIAGVDAVVASTWVVGDAATRRLMVRFHAHRVGGKDTALALRDARRDLFAGGEDGDDALVHPWFWAGWVLHR